MEILKYSLLGFFRVVIFFGEEKNEYDYQKKWKDIFIYKNVNRKNINWKVK